jgi:hypothetical protein
MTLEPALAALGVQGALGAWDWLMGAYSLGVLGFGLRKLPDGRAMRREAILSPGEPPHIRALGAVLPLGLRMFHGRPGVRHASGIAKVVLGKGLARWVLRLLGMSLVAGSQSLAVTFTPDGAGERWTRRFGGGGFTTRIAASGEGNLEECFGPFSFAFRLSAEAGELRWVLIGSWLVGIPLPRALWPRVTAREWSGAEGRYCMLVDIALPLLGPLLRYEGTLEAE